MSPSPQLSNEIERLMRDPDSMRDEWERMQRSGQHGGYDSNQPRVPAGNPVGGQWTATSRSADANESTGLPELAQAQKQQSPSLEELARICAMDPAKVAADFANPFFKGVGKVDPMTGQVRTLDWVRQEARKMEQLVRELQRQLCRPA
jgi:hypothetical protein